MLCPNSLVFTILIITLSSINTVINSLDFLSIDCGSSESYTGKNNITSWVNDDNYVRDGKSYLLPSQFGVRQDLRTLRAFPSKKKKKKKNCYTIDGVGAGVKILVRANFFYGNYDGMGLPPTVDLLLDGVKWATVNTTMQEDSYQYSEAIYVTASDVIDVCVASPENGGIPFVSSIEIRSLLSTMYQELKNNTAIVMASRLAFGASHVVRYSDNPYDRNWDARVAGNRLKAFRRDSNSHLNTSSATNMPPESVLQSAVVPETFQDLFMFFPELPSTLVNVIIYMYFTEMSQLGLKESRAFQVMIVMDDSDLFIPDVIRPPYGEVLQIKLIYLKASSATMFVLRPMATSTLPPIISAVEVYKLSDLVTAADRSDVAGLTILQKHFNVLATWTGDPCLPLSYSWEWVECIYTNKPRIKALYLSGYGLSGPLPDFRVLTALEKIDMKNNNINGSIPEFLGLLPNLKELNLANNNFQGIIPSSLRKNTKIKLNVNGNPNLQQSTREDLTLPTETKNRNNLPIVLGIKITTSVLFLVVVCLGFGAYLYRRRKTATVMPILFPFPEFEENKDAIPFPLKQGLDWDPPSVSLTEIDLLVERQAQNLPR